MKYTSLLKIAIIGAAFAAGAFSSAHIEEHYSSISSRDLVLEAKSFLRPALVHVGLKEPLKAADDFQQPIFVDIERVFTKAVSDNGDITMSEHPVGSFADIFSRESVIFESERDAIYERFSAEGIDRRITFTKSAKDFPMSLVRLLATVVKHGSNDDAQLYGASMETLKKRQLSMTCGAITLFAKDVLRDAGVTSRVVTTLNLGEWNTYSNGHTFLEVLNDKTGRWEAVDLDTKTIFVAPGGIRASALDIANHGIDEVGITRLTSTPVLDYSGFTEYQTTAEYMLYDLRGWYGKMVQAVGIYDENSKNYIFLAKNSEAEKRIEAYSPNYKATDPDQFSDLFYRR